MTPLATMSSSFSHLFLVLYGHLLLGMLDGEKLGSVLMVYIPDMLPMVLKELGKACFSAIVFWTWAVEEGEVTLGNCTLRADLVGSVGLGQRQHTRVGISIDLAGVLKGLLHHVPLICEELP